MTRSVVNVKFSISHLEKYFYLLSILTDDRYCTALSSLPNVTYNPIITKPIQTHSKNFIGSSRAAVTHSNLYRKIQMFLSEINENIAEIVIW